MLLAVAADRRGQLGVGAGDRRPGGNQVAQRRAVGVRVVVSPRQRDRRGEGMQQIAKVLPLLGCQLTVTDRNK
ncbi:MAG: hypothetical protein JO281_04505 [Pseudonocardiales bacterium]|nr:hypothetical protein [Pseudonocardiales bacterium]